MPGTENPRELLTERLAILEKRLQWQYVVHVGLLLLVVASLALPSRRIRTGSVQAKALVLRDAEGRSRIGLGVSKNGHATLTVSDTEGRHRLVLGLRENGEPGITVVDGAGRVRAEIQESRGRVYQRFYSTDGRRTMTIQEGGDGRWRVERSGAPLPQSAAPPNAAPPRPDPQPAAPVPGR